MKKFLLCITMLFILSGCTTAPFMPAQGLVYTNNKAPLAIGFNRTDLGSKVGQSSSYSFLGLFAFGDVSAQTAAKNANIKVMKHADYQYKNIMFLFTKTTISVYGD